MARVLCVTREQSFLSKTQSNVHNVRMGTHDILLLLVLHQQMFVSPVLQDFLEQKEGKLRVCCAT